MYPLLTSLTLFADPLLKTIKDKRNIFGCFFSLNFYLETNILKPKQRVRVAHLRKKVAFRSRRRVCLTSQGNTRIDEHTRLLAAGGGETPGSKIEIRINNIYKQVQG